jgi:hypothetical protein
LVNNSEEYLAQIDWLENWENLFNKPFLKKKNDLRKKNNSWKNRLMKRIKIKIKIDCLIKKK